MEKLDIYQMVTNTIIEQLEKGKIPWKKEWDCVNAPVNFVTKKPYRGMNVFLLGCKGYKSPYWLSFKQVKDKRGFVKQGEKSSIVVFWEFLTFKDKENLDENGVPAIKQVPLLKYYRVFNTEQCEGLTVPAIEERQFTPIEECEKVVNGYNMTIEYKGDKACYSPQLDIVRMPAKEQFKSEQGFYSTLFHELTHSTGHITRLNREFGTHFGSENYSYEELIAELGACMLCNFCGIHTTIENSTAYIQSWLKVLKNDKKMIVTASGKAQKAVDFILGKEVVKAE